MVRFLSAGFRTRFGEHVRQTKNIIGAFVLIPDYDHFQARELELHYPLSVAPLNASGISYRIFDWGIGLSHSQNSSTVLTVTLPVSILLT